MGILTAIGDGLRAIAALFGYARQRDAEKNTSQMQANAAAKTDAQISHEVAKAEDAAANGDLDQVRDLAAE